MYARAIHTNVEVHTCAVQDNSIKNTCFLWSFYNENIFRSVDTYATSTKPTYESISWACTQKVLSIA